MSDFPRSGLQPKTVPYIREPSHDRPTLVHLRNAIQWTFDAITYKRKLDTDYYT